MWGPPLGDFAWVGDAIQRASTGSWQLDMGSRLPSIKPNALVTLACEDSPELVKTHINNIRAQLALSAVNVMVIVSSPAACHAARQVHAGPVLTVKPASGADQRHLKHI